MNPDGSGSSDGSRGSHEPRPERAGPRNGPSSAGPPELSLGIAIATRTDGISNCTQCGRAISDAPSRAHTGEVLRDADRLLGRSVILAARIAAAAAGGEVLVSSLLCGLSASLGDFRFGSVREVRLEGIAELQQLYSVEWS